ncbi:hypothetical protein BC628DRAFT_1418961 [Trametes gibbosa]|nr:hypothetical protein BC628DRAFT_1418961 [Trametes gibbosa]
MNLGCWDLGVESNYGGEDEDVQVARDNDGDPAPAHAGNPAGEAHPGEDGEEDYDYTWRPYPRPATLFGLLPFAPNCPVLDCLAVEFDARLTLSWSNLKSYCLSIKL